MLEIPANEKVLLVMGGSQGAQQLNAILLQILPQLITDMTVLHLTGEDHFQAVSTVSQELLDHSPRKHLYKPFPYLTDKLPYALAAADAVVSRAGASTLSELARLRKPSLLIPLDRAANDHQRKNAYEYAKTGATIIIEEDNLTPNLFSSNIASILEDKVVMEKMATSASAFAIRDSAEIIAKEILQLRGVM